MHSQVDGELMLAPGFSAPPNTDYVGYHTYIGTYTVFKININVECTVIKFVFFGAVFKFLLVIGGCKTNNSTMKFSQNVPGRTCDNQDRGCSAQTTCAVC
jgi:hypothetical protein